MRFDFKIKNGLVLSQYSVRIFQLKGGEIHFIYTPAGLEWKTLPPRFYLTELIAPISTIDIFVIAFLSRLSDDSISTLRNTNVPELSVWCFVKATLTNALLIDSVIDIMNWGYAGNTDLCTIREYLRNETAMINHANIGVILIRRHANIAFPSRSDIVRSCTSSANTNLQTLSAVFSKLSTWSALSFDNVCCRIQCINKIISGIAAETNI